MDTQKHGNKEKLSIRKVPLYLLVNLKFEKRVLTIKTKIKSRLHYIDIIAYHRIYINNISISHFYIFNHLTCLCLIMNKITLFLNS